MPESIAYLRSENLNLERIDHDNGIVYGVVIAELGKVACFAGPDGKPRYATISSRHVDAFLAHAGNRSIPVHWTHDKEEGKDRLHSKVACLKNFRKDDSGNPIADMYISPGDKREEILWNAAHDRENMMLSPVYGYDPGDKESIPLSFKAADLVEKGAATTALFEQYNRETKPMEKAELLALLKDALKDPEIVVLLTPKAAPVAMDEATMRKLIADGVTAEMTKMDEALNLKAQAAVTAKLGTNAEALLNLANQANGETFEKVIEAEMASMEVPNRAKAIAVGASKKPKLYNAWCEKGGR